MVAHNIIDKGEVRNGALDRILLHNITQIARFKFWLRILIQLT